MSSKKYKDLEENIKNASTKIDVPDVYSNVKDTPIRKLKKGQAPSKYFSRKAALAVLAFLTLMLVIMSVAFLAMALNDKSQLNTYSPVVISLTVEKDGTLNDYILLCENTGTIKYAINKTQDTMQVDIHGLALTKAINTLSKPKNGDKYTFNILSTNSELESNLLSELQGKLKSDYGTLEYTFQPISDIDAKVNIVTFINSKISDSAITKDSDVSSIYSRLTEIALQNM